jgi:hypothetical protein
MEMKVQKWTNGYSSVYKGTLTRGRLQTRVGKLI